MLWHDEHSADGPDWVMEGRPVAQYYGLGGYWANWRDLKDITKVLGPNSPANEVGGMAIGLYLRVSFLGRWEGEIRREVVFFLHEYDRLA